MLVNLCPHPINLYIGGALNSTILPSGGIARCSQRQEYVETWLGIPITRQTFGKVTGLPAPKEGVRDIVSSRVADACPDRKDLVVPGPAVRDENGNQIGCEGLSVMYKNAADNSVADREIAIKSINNLMVALEEADTLGYYMGDILNIKQILGIKQALGINEAESED